MTGADRGAGAECIAGAERAVCMLCWPRLLKVLVAWELCTPMNAPFDSGRLIGAARSMEGGAARETLTGRSSRCAAGRASSCRMAAGAAARETASRA